MPSQFFGLNIGASALSAFQASVNTTVNNISNVQTKGYIGNNIFFSTILFLHLLN